MDSHALASAGCTLMGAQRSPPFLGQHIHLPDSSRLPGVAAQSSVHLSLNLQPFQQVTWAARQCWEKTQTPGQSMRIDASSRMAESECRVQPGKAPGPWSPAGSSGLVPVHHGGTLSPSPRMPSVALGGACPLCAKAGPWVMEGPEGVFGVTCEGGARCQATPFVRNTC